MCIYIRMDIEKPWLKGLALRNFVDFARGTHFEKAPTFDQQALLTYQQYAT